MLYQEFYCITFIMNSKIDYVPINKACTFFQWLAERGYGHSSFTYSYSESYMLATKPLTESTKLKKMHAWKNISKLIERHSCLGKRIFKKKCLCSRLIPGIRIFISFVTFRSVELNKIASYHNTWEVIPNFFSSLSKNRESLKMQ